MAALLRWRMMYVPLMFGVICHCHLGDVRKARRHPLKTWPPSFVFPRYAINSCLWRYSYIFNWCFGAWSDCNFEISVLILDSTVSKLMDFWYSSYSSHSWERVKFGINRTENASDYRYFERHSKQRPCNAQHHIHSNRRSCSNRCSPPFIIKLLTHKNSWNRWFLYKNAWVWGQCLSPSLCTNLMSCSRSLRYY